MGSAFAKAINDLDEDALQALYGRWDPPEPAQVAGLLDGSGGATLAFAEYAQARATGWPASRPRPGPRPG